MFISLALSDNDSLVEVVKSVLNVLYRAARDCGKVFSASMADVGGGTSDEIIATAIVMFLIFLPLFAYDALSEAIGDKALFRTLFVRRLEFKIAHQKRTGFSSP